MRMFEVPYDGGRNSSTIGNNRYVEVLKSERKAKGNGSLNKGNIRLEELKRPRQPDYTGKGLEAVYCYMDLVGN